MSIIRQHLTPAAGPSAPDSPYQALKGRVRELLLGRIDPTILFSPHDARLRETVRAAITGLADLEPALQGPGRAALVTRLCHDLVGFGPIQPLIDDPAVVEIMVNRYDDIWTERAGRLGREDAVRFGSDQEVRDLCERIALPLRRRIDETNPILDGRLPDGSRVNAVLTPVALDGACLTIRKFARALTVERLLALGTLTPPVVRFLRTAVGARSNVLVVGATSSGKTSLLNALSSFIPGDERIVTIEDAAELMLQQPHVLRLETRPPNIEGRGEITVRDLVRNALRMRPDRIVVGECRGPEALDMMQAANTGHDGTFSTLHANSPADALARLETMALMADSGLPARAIRQQIGAAFDLVIEAGRLKDGRRRILAIAEVGRGPDGEPACRDLYRYEPGSDRLLAVAEPVRIADRCRWLGLALEGGL